MGPSQVIGGTETDPSRYIKMSLGSVGFSPATGLEIFCNPGRSLVLFLQSTQTNLAPRPGRPANNSTTKDQESKNSADSGVVSNWIPHGFHKDSTWYLFCRKDISGLANTILITFFPKYALFVIQKIVKN
jgi:hypothetical protein